MEEIRIVIVDDSSFSIAFLRDIFERNGLKVVGEAGTLEEVREVIKEQRPTLVTMDMTLPGTDGLECTRAVHDIDENIKVIVVSSMMDEEIVKEARKNKVSAYIQKPVDADELMTTINRVMASEELYQFLESEYFVVFKEALMDSLNRMTKTIPAFEKEFESSSEFESQGMTVIIGIIGKFSGRMLLDLPTETAQSLVSAVLKREPKNRDEVTAVLGEFANIISGNACSLLNRKKKELGLRVAPPAMLHGDSVLISAPNFTTTNVIAQTDFGTIMLNVGFQRGEEKWM